MIIDEKKLPPAMRQYVEIKKQYDEYIIFYRLGDFYEMFFDDALTASKALDITLTKRGKCEDIDIPMCGVPYHAYESYLARLIKQGYKVAICEQMESPEEAKKRGSKSVVKREIVRLVTSGTLTEEVLLDSRRNNYLLAIADGKDTLGFSWLDLSTGEFYTQKIEYCSQNKVQEIYNMLSRLNPGEILFADSLQKDHDIFALLHEYQEKLSPLPQERFDYANALRRIKAYFRVKTLDSFGDFSTFEIIAAGVVLDYIEITQKEGAPRIQKPIQIVGSQYMEIDGATASNLDLFTGPQGSSLISVIDRTITGSGSRQLKKNFAAPLLDKDKINQRLDMIEFFIKHHDVRKKLREILKQFPDVAHSISRLSLKRKDGPNDLRSILMMMTLLPKIKTIIECFKPVDVVDEMSQSVRNVLANFKDHSALADLLNRALDETKDFPQLARDGGFIAPNFSPELDIARQMRDEGHQYILNLEGKYVEKTGIEHLRIKYNSVVGYFIEVPTKNVKQLLDNPEFIHRQSVMNAARFTTMELTDLENKFRSATDRALSIELEIYEKLVCDVLVEADDIIKSTEAVASIDVAAALADLALENDYCRPYLDDSLTLEIECGRHPVVENALHRSGEEKFVSNDCNLSVDKNRIWLITGPNMAGKSTFLRQNAIIAVMAQAGSYVPAKSAHIGIVNKLFSRVGASDDLAHGRSTFMVEMVETAAILNRADEHSFVILDEIGRGTATFDGLSIAWATVEYLYECNKCRALFATHYHELAELAKKLPLLTLHRMKIKEFNNQVVFLHEIVDGAADRSYGIHVAKLAGLPSKVTTRAQTILQHLEEDGQKHSINNTTLELPLFSYADNNDKDDQFSIVEQELQKIDPDNLTARQALEKLYQLKELLKDK